MLTLRLSEDKSLVPFIVTALALEIINNNAKNVFSCTKKQKKPGYLKVSGDLCTWLDISFKSNYANVIA